MPLGTPVSAGVPTGSAAGNVKHFTGIANRWVTVIDAVAGGTGGMEIQDAGVAPGTGTITDPDGEITSSTRHICRVNGRGSIIEARMKYDDGDTRANTALVRVFGRAGNDAWMRLRLVGSANSQGTILTSTADPEDGTFAYTITTALSRWDLYGCDQFLVGVENNYEFLGGNEDRASLQARVV